MLRSLYEEPEPPIEEYNDVDDENIITQSNITNWFLREMGSIRDINGNFDKIDIKFYKKIGNYLINSKLKKIIKKLKSSKNSYHSYLLGKIYLDGVLEVSNFEKAEECFKNGIKKNNILCALVLGYCYYNKYLQKLNTKNKIDLIDDLNLLKKSKKLFKKCGKNGCAYFKLAEIYLRSDKKRKAIKYYEKSIKLGIKDAPYITGNLYEKIGDMENTEKKYIEGIEKYNCKNCLGALYFYYKNKKININKNLKKLCKIVIKTKNENILRLCVEKIYYTNNFKLCLKLLKELLKLNQNNTTTLLNLYLVCINISGKNKKSKEYLKKANDLGDTRAINEVIKLIEIKSQKKLLKSKNDSDSIIKLGKIYFNENKLDKSKSIFKKLKKSQSEKYLEIIFREMVKNKMKEYLKKNGNKHSYESWTYQYEKIKNNNNNSKNKFLEYCKCCNKNIKQLKQHKKSKIHSINKYCREYEKQLRKTF